MKFKKGEERSYLMNPGNLRHSGELMLMKKWHQEINAIDLP